MCKVSYSRSSPFTITLPTVGLGPYNQWHVDATVAGISVFLVLITYVTSRCVFYVQ